MTNEPIRERLQDRHYVVLLLLLLVDRQGQIIQGEIGSAEHGDDVVGRVRFRGPDGLLRAVQTCVTAERTS